MDTVELKIDPEVPHREKTEQLVSRELGRLERHCDHITSCRVAVEAPNARVSSGSPYRVRLDVRVAGAQPLVVRREPGERSADDGVEAVIRDAFHAMQRRLEALNDRQHGVAKSHPEQTVQGVIDDLKEGFGFVVTTDHRQVYFHRNAVLGTDFDDLRVGMGVAFTETTGDEGPNASSLRVVDRRAGARERPSDLMR